MASVSKKIIFCILVIVTKYHGYSNLYPYTLVTSKKASNISPCQFFIENGEKYIFMTLLLKFG